MSAAARYFEPSTAVDCACDKGGDDCSCSQDALDAHEDAAIDAADSLRKRE